MKLLQLPLFLLALLVWTGCDDEEAAVIETLSYDGPNVSAPQLPPGDNSLLVYFPPSETGKYVGRRLEKVRFYMSEIPLATSVVVYDEGPDDRTPGTERYRRDLTARINATGWFEDRLASPIEITGDGLWLAIDVTIAEGSTFSVGCDAGRTYDRNGDLLQLSTNPSVIAGFQDINGETVSWNIRGVISEPN